MRRLALRLWDVQASLVGRVMDVFFAMGTPTTEDSSGYFLRLPHLWSVYVVPFVCFYAILGVWVVRKIRSTAGTRCGSAAAANLASDDIDHAASDDRELRIGRANSWTV